jgi:hypothetical protein
MTADLAIALRQTIRILRAHCQCPPCGGSGWIHLGGTEPPAHHVTRCMLCNGTGLAKSDLKIEADNLERLIATNG